MTREFVVTVPGGTITGWQQGEGPHVLLLHGGPGLSDYTERLCAIGANQPDFQPGAGRWRVLLDPDGLPFCLSAGPAVVP